jgi:AGZA family xanthine/uracil permease-like MFS transporter
MDAGVVYRGMEVLGGGAILAGMILASVAAFIIDKNFKHAAIYAVAGAILSFFGFIHGAKLGIGESADVALGYLLLAGICIGMARQQPAEVDEPEPAAAEAA